MDKLKVGILAGTGMVGQKYISLLAGHPWFEVTHVSASERSAGKNRPEHGRLFGNRCPAETVFEQGYLSERNRHFHNHGTGD